MLVVLPLLIELWEAAEDFARESEAAREDDALVGDKAIEALVATLRGT
jgi:hypothetical protein